MATTGSPNMYFDPLKLQQIDDELQDTVFRFIRNHEKLLTCKSTLWHFGKLYWLISDHVNINILSTFN